MSDMVSEHKHEVSADIVKELRSLNKNLAAQNSYLRNFLQSILRGVGAVVGATVITSLLFAVLYGLYRTSIESLPFIKSVLPQSTVELYIKPQNK